MDGGSRWGIKGANELGEGLSATYRFEHKFSTEDASQAGGRLANVGLSGGFGSLTLGQIWSASYNSTGAITDNSLLWGDAATSYRVGNALSYAVSAGSISMQIDAVMGGGTRTSRAVDQLEFGLTVDLGDVGKVAFAHVNKEDTLMTGVVTPAVEGMPATYQTTNHNKDGTADDTAPAMMMDVTVAANDTTNVTDGALNATGLGAIVRATDGSGTLSIGTCDAEDAEADDACTTVSVWVSTLTTYTTPAGGGAVTPATNVQYHALDSEVIEEATAAVAAMDAVMGTLVDTNGSKSNHVAAQFGFGGVTLHLGQSQSKTNNTGAKTTVTHYGVAGSMGDTGLNYLLQARKVKAGGASTDPWLVSFNRSLGDGATAFVEHANNDDGKSGKTWVGLKVDF